MKLEYLEHGGPECPLLLLSGFSTAEVGEFQTALRSLASGAVPALVVHELPYVQSVEGCQLELSIKAWDQGVTGSRPAFKCQFTKERWENIAGLIDPFKRFAVGYQWLHQSTEACSFLFSASGKW